MSKLIDGVFYHIQRELGRPLDTRTKKEIIATYNQIDPVVFKPHKLSDVIPILSKFMIDELKLRPTMNNNTPRRVIESLTDAKNNQVAIGMVDDTPDIKETLKDIIGSASETTSDKYVSSLVQPSAAMQETKEVVADMQINSFLGIDNLTTLQLLFNPESLYVHFYVVLDSNYRIIAEEGTSVTRFSWNYTESQNIENGFCNSVGRVRDVIGMRMYQPRVPYVVAMDTTSKRVSVLVEELKAQAFIGENGRRFHFLFRPDYATSGTSIELSTEDFNDGIFSFRKPITTFDSLSITFGDPLNLIAIPKPFDRFMIPIEFVCLRSDK